ncbi:hypothetical protein ACXJJ3_10980 [Kribbella sp. WER1]
MWLGPDWWTAQTRHPTTPQPMTLRAVGLRTAELRTAGLRAVGLAARAGTTVLRLLGMRMVLSGWGSRLGGMLLVGRSCRRAVLRVGMVRLTGWVLVQPLVWTAMEA